MRKKIKRNKVHFLQSWHFVTSSLSQIRYSLVVILELNSISEVQYKEVIIIDNK